MKEANFKAAQTIHKIGNQTDKAAFEIIKELGLKDKQKISEDELVIVAKAKYPHDYELKLNCLLDSKYFQTIYVVDLKAKRDDSYLLSADQ